MMKHSNLLLVEQTLKDEGLFIHGPTTQVISAKARMVVIDYLRQTHTVGQCSLTDQELLNAYLENTFFDELYDAAICSDSDFCYLPYI